MSCAMLQEKYSNAFLGAGPEDKHFALELTYNYGVDHYDLGSGFGHFALATNDVYKLVDSIKKAGVRHSPPQPSTAVELED
jgi:lactoylglutathione lyase